MHLWQGDKQDTDVYLPMVKAICGVFLIGEALLELDRDENTDLMILTASDLRIAVRLRAPKYWMNPGYRQEFTIRDTRPKGNDTEFDKIRQGFGDYFFYGFRTEQPPHLYGFGLLGLAVFCDWVESYYAQHGAYPGKRRPNHDKSSTFRVFRWADIPLPAIVCMYPKSIAQGATCVTPAERTSIQLALQLTWPAEEVPLIRGA